MTGTREPASGGVKIVEIGRFENRCIRGRIPVKRRCSSARFQKKNGGRRYFDVPKYCGIRDLCKELTFDDNAGRNGDKQGPPAGE
jgi:hypothetical protein